MQTGTPAAFLDRDGTIIVDRNYPSEPTEVELLPGAAAGLRALHAAGYLLVVITNQSGIARGYYDHEAFRSVQRRVEELLEAEGVRLDGVWYCPHHPDFTGPCDCRKPGLRLFREAAETLAIDFGRSLFIGDRPHDVEPARPLGGRPILIGDRTQTDAAVLPGVEVAADLPAAAALAAEGPSS
jgi:D-glycero-D-manno-heptose 1,7-bisphosphate phosphatase